MSYFKTTYSGEDESAREQFLELSRALTGEMVAPLLGDYPARPRLGRIAVADGVNWDPIGAGVPRLVWFNGTDWVALDA